MVDWRVLFLMRVLDTAALLYWPVTQIAGGVCATSQQAELERVSPERFMLVNSIEVDWRDVDPQWLGEARLVAAQSGDLPRLSDVDLDVLALALGLNVELFTDDYRLQNVMKNAGLSTKPVGVKPAKQVWQWQLRCTGCRTTQPVPKDVKTSKQGPVKDCDICGSPMMLKRAK